MSRVYAFTSDPAALNSYLVVGAERALVVDTGAGPRQAAGILAAVRAVTELPLTVVNTHDHWDHFFGNATFRAAGVEDFRAGVGFVRDQAGSAWYQYHSVPLEAEPDLPPDPGQLIVDVRPLGAGEAIELGGASVVARELAGHTDSDLVLIVDDVALVGDLVEEGAPPSVGEDATPGRWAQALRDVLALPGIAVFCPGHGQPVDRAFVQEQAANLAELAADPAAEVRELATAPFAWAEETGTAGLRRLR
ncbi:MBL fold metallo-hydrolase [Brevibacterium sp. 5221]|uniref:MBL fold metallo-hydrolase n=1 Tax=Brevibacterium rongguiense TaxID=2695267 RepID=A0A6N9H3Z6_9MICO|nr:MULTISPECIES: MBL fold metallo-hydrolase [Brevibacterium]MYM18476.1 MBL fold metallo-hydrolase [Brevibacterium rongguiense]WAL41528.1 MBL fold metallo-hydrolase [Brevibacterium sp. BRM-1]